MVHDDLRKVIILLLVFKYVLYNVLDIQAMSKRCK